MIAISDVELAAAPAPALLRPVSTDWDAVSPAMRRFELAAGPEWIARCSELGELPVGSAVISDAGALPAEYVIHVAVRSRDEPVSRRSVEAALRNGLRRAVEWSIGRLALPLLGTGPGNLDPAASCEAMDAELRRFAGPGRSGEVVVCCTDAFELEAARRQWEDAATEGEDAGHGGEAGPPRAL